MKSWTIAGEHACKARARTTCRQCIGKGHSATLNEKKGVSSKLLKQAGFSELPIWKKKGMAGILKEKYPGSYKIMNRDDKEKGACKGSMSLYWIGQKTGNQT